MSSLNLLDTKLADRQAVGLLGGFLGGFNGRHSCETNIRTITHAPVGKSKKKKKKLYDESWLYELCLFPFGHFLSSSDPHVVEHSVSSAVRKTQLTTSSICLAEDD